MNREIEVVPDQATFERRAAERVAAAIRQAVKARGRAHVALSGGSTPRDVYRVLATKLDLPWEDVMFFFGDERPVPPDDKESNFRMARESLFEPLWAAKKLPRTNVHRIEAEKGARAAAELYEAELKTQLGTSLPAFDLILLGLGPDGHTASLFPGTAGLAEKNRWVIGNFVEKFGVERITFTFPLINHAHEAMFLARGADKADPAARVLDQPDGPLDDTPARGVRAQKVTWLLDSAAAAKSQAAKRG